MERFVKGDLVVVPVLFSGLSEGARCLALVLTDLRGNDMLICATSPQAEDDIFAQKLMSEDLISGSLSSDLYVRPQHIFTIDKHLVFRKIGRVTPERLNKVIDAIIYTLKQ
jgi:mRNA interferase MazF